MSIENRTYLIKQFSKKIYPIKLKFDGLLSVLSNQKEIDILDLDEKFSKHDHDYNCNKATYKNQPCSMIEYIQLKYGNAAVYYFNNLIK